ncbi:uncharacterized protein LOC115702294 [Cannabis sativa]|uniref:uncharacterized protein LOC115702294 n=1 Tax=Cannabis sativa TaxID=3483 RepID=UPI0029CA5DCC|nr:uncharacterized protein LOC115702294 [Cannabis sativa]
MKKYYPIVPNLSHQIEPEVDRSSKRHRNSINMANLPTDPGLQAPISDYNPNIQDEIRRYYLQQGPCQLRSHNFPPTFFGKQKRWFNIACIRFLLRQGLAFCVHDESQNSTNQGNFLELLTFLADHNEEIRVVALKNAPENLKLTSPKIQKDIVNACAVETINVIIEDIGDAIFSVLVDESRDVAIKEQMVVMCRYVDKKWYVIERFIGIEHVPNTTSISLKIAIDKLYSKHGLSISRLRGQGYDGASNMSGEFNGLKSIIMKENECAFFVYCFAHQLQLTLMDVAKKHDLIGTFLIVVSNVVNIVGASSKRCGILREKQAAKVIEALKSGQLSSRKGLNQENWIKCPCETRWGSHFCTLVSFTIMFSSIIDVLEEIASDSLNSDQKSEASIMLQVVQTYDFVFSLHLVKNILGITNELSQVLQKR